MSDAATDSATAGSRRAASARKAQGLADAIVAALDHAVSHNGVLTGYAAVMALGPPALRRPPLRSLALIYHTAEDVTGLVRSIRAKLPHLNVVELFNPAVGIASVEVDGVLAVTASLLSRDELPPCDTMPTRLSHSGRQWTVLQLVPPRLSLELRRRNTRSKLLTYLDGFVAEWCFAHVQGTAHGNVPQLTSPALPPSAPLPAGPHFDHLEEYDPAVQPNVDATPGVISRECFLEGHRGHTEHSADMTMTPGRSLATSGVPMNPAVQYAMWLHNLTWTQLSVWAQTLVRFTVLPDIVPFIPMPVLTLDVIALRAAHARVMAVLMTGEHGSCDPLTAFLVFPDADGTAAFLRLPFIGTPDVCLRAPLW